MKIRFLTLIIALLLVLPLAACANGNNNNEETDPPIDNTEETTAEDIPVVVDPATDSVTEPVTEPAPTKPRVALTFDDGPHNVRTRAIVDELAKYGFHATFFVIGNRIDGTAYNSRDTLNYIAENGNEIGIHGYTHSVYYDTCSDADYQTEISRTSDVIHEKLPDYEIKLMRPVGGRITNERLSASPYSVILWNVDSEDWRYKYASGDSDTAAAEKVNKIVENVMNQVADGDIILMHDIYESTYDATVIILQRLNEMGYDVVTVSELFGNKLTPGTKYMSAPPIIQ